MSGPDVSMIVAMAENHVIGKDNELPWHIPDDLKHFKAKTVGKPVIMGRKTFESIKNTLGGPLPGRANIVVSTSVDVIDGATVCRDLDEALYKAGEAANLEKSDEIIIGGGAQIYEQALNYTKRIYLTQVHRVVEGDTHFPDLDPGEWVEVTREDHMDAAPPHSFLTLERVAV